MRRLALAIGCLLALAPSIARPCGGPELSDVAAVIAPPESTVQPLMHGDGTWDASPPGPFRFLEPTRLEKPACGELLSKIAYEIGTDSEELRTVGLPSVDAEAFEAAVRRGDLAAARREARRMVDAVLDQALPVARENAGRLSLGVEFLELAPHLEKADRARIAERFADHKPNVEVVAPEIAAAAHRPVKELEALVARTHAEIADGFPGQIAGTQEKTWKSLLGGFDAWLEENPRHPLADVARLRKLRVLYLKGDLREAWSLLFELHARRPCRAVWEMRHLLLQDGQNALSVELARIDDPVMASSLLPHAAPLTREGWDQLWKRSEEHARTPWGLNLQERLLGDAVRLASGGALPAAFPAAQRKPSELWGQLRAAALIRAKAPEAVAQAAALNVDKDAVSARLASGAYAMAGDWVKAAEPKALPEDEARYLLDVLADDGSLAKLAASKAPRARAAALALAMRRLHDGAWEDGARALDGVDPARAALWRDAARRSKDDSGKGRLALARWLARAPLFQSQEPGYSRGLKSRLQRLDGKARDGGEPPGLAVPGEKARLEEHLLRSGGRQRALEAFAAALAKLPPASREARAALAEANKTFNALLNWDHAMAGAYEQLLRSSPAAAAIREAGKAVGPAR